MNLSKEKWESITLDAALEHNTKVLASGKHTYYNFCKSANEFLKSKISYLSDKLPPSTMLTIDSNLKDTYDNSIPRHNFRFMPIYVAWKCYTFLFQDEETKILEPNHEDFRCHASHYQRSPLLSGLAYDCKLLHKKSNQTLEMIFETIGSKDTSNEEYSDNWSLHTPMKEEYDTSSVYYLSATIMALELEEIEEQKAKKKKREAKAKLKQDRIDKKEREDKAKLIKIVEAARKKAAEDAEVARVEAERLALERL